MINNVGATKKYDIDLSIVMCCFNGEKFLEESLNSLLSQTKLDFELIFINDGSTDQTEAIFFRMSIFFRNFRYIYQENLGLQKSRNMGLSISSVHSRFIMFLDSDDTFVSNFIETLYSTISSFDHVASVHCGIQHFGICSAVNNYGDLFEFKFGLPVRSKKDRVNLFDILSGNHRLVEASGIYRKSLINKIGGWDEINFPKGETYGESIPMFANLVLQGDVIFINKCLYNYRIHDQQITSTLKPNLRAMDVSTNNVLLSHFTGMEYYLIKSMIVCGSYLIDFRGRFKYLLRYKVYAMFIHVPLFIICYITYLVGSFIPTKNIRDLIR